MRPLRHVTHGHFTNTNAPFVTCDIRSDSNGTVSISVDSTIFIMTSIYFVLYLYDVALTQNTVPMIHSIHFSYPPIICTLISLLVCAKAGSQFTLS